MDQEQKSINKERVDEILRRHVEIVVEWFNFIEIEFSQWIELYNPSEEVLHLGDFPIEIGVCISSFVSHMFYLRRDFRNHFDSDNDIMISTSSIETLGKWLNRIYQMVQARLKMDKFINECPFCLIESNPTPMTLPLVSLIHKTQRLPCPEKVLED